MSLPNDPGWTPWQPYYKHLTSPVLIAGVNNLIDIPVRPNQELALMQAWMECDTIIASIAYIGVNTGATFYRFFGSNFVAADTLYGGELKLLLAEHNKVQLQATGAASGEIMQLWLHGMTRNKIPPKT